MSPAEQIAQHLKAIMDLLETNAPTNEFVKELLERATAIAPDGALSPNMAAWRSAAYRKLPRILAGF